ncbi:MAG TPA: hypothetical protein VIU61_30355 [Kofleriaceae bacterium]
MNPDPFDEPTRPVQIHAAYSIEHELVIDLDTLDIDDETDPSITPWRLTSLRELAEFLDEETLPD